MFVPAANTATQIKTLNDANRALPAGYTLAGRHPSYGLTSPGGESVGSFRSLQGAIKAATQHVKGVLINPPNPNGGRLVWFKATSGRDVSLKNKTLASLGKAMAISDAKTWAVEFPNEPYDGSDWDQEAFKTWKLTDATGNALSDERTARVWEAYTEALPLAIAARLAKP
jgi:hypothetical protein